MPSPRRMAAWFEKVVLRGEMRALKKEESRLHRMTDLLDLAVFAGRVRSSLDRSGVQLPLEAVAQSNHNGSDPLRFSPLSLIGGRFQHRPSHPWHMKDYRMQCLDQKKTLSDPANYLNKIYYFCLSDCQSVIPVFPNFSLLI